MAETSNTTVIIVGIILIAVLFGADLRLWDFLDNLFEGWEDLFDLPFGDSLGVMGIGMTIEFADGHTETIHPEDAGPLMPLRVDFGGDRIISLTYELHVKASWSGNLLQSQGTGAIGCYRNQGNATIGEAIIGYGGIPINGSWNKVGWLTVTDTEIEAICFADGPYQLDGYATYASTWTFEGGQSDSFNTKLGPVATAIWVIPEGIKTYQTQFPQPTPLYP